MGVVQEGVCRLCTNYPVNRNTAWYFQLHHHLPWVPWVPSPSRAHLEAQTTIDKGRKLLAAEGKDRKGG